LGSGLIVELGYVLWDTVRPPYVCALGGLEGVPRLFELKDGVSRAKDFDEHAHFQMSPTYPYDIRLADSLKNADRLVVASRRLKEFLEGRGLDHVEYLPVAILNHKGRVASREYHVIHLTDPIDCLDIPKCRATQSMLIPEDILDVEELVLEPTRLDQDRLLFRAQYYDRPVFVRRDLAAEIENGGFVGIRFAELTDYSKIK
jgi:hypothetical protein